MAGVVTAYGQNIILGGRGRTRPRFATAQDFDGSFLWEREGENREYFERFSPSGYAIGVNAVLYGMTH